MQLKHLIIGVVLLASCSSEKTYKIGVSQCGAGQWREKVNNEMLAAQHLFDQNAKVVIACAYDDSKHQIYQIDSLLKSGIDLLVVAPNESKELDDAITKVREKGIPVIFFDRKASANNYTAFIGGSNEEAGKAMGQYAVSLGGTSVMEITGALSTSPALERHKGFAQVIAGHKDTDYVWEESDWSSDEAYHIVKNRIKSGLLPDVIFCHNDGMATGVYKAVKELKKEGQVKILGIDGLPGEGIEYVQFGHQVGTYIYPTHGEEIIKLALNILTKKPYERENTLQGMLVTPENANIADLNSRELMRQNNNLITIQDKLEDYFGLYNTQHKLLIASFITIVILFLAILMIGIAYWQRRKTIRQRQAMNEEQTLFYTDASNRKLREVFFKPEEALPPAKSQDLLFAEQLNEAIHKNMSNPCLKMDDLGEEMGLSRVQLYRKVKAITGQTPVELLRQMRLQQAYALLTSTTKTVGEIAYEVGFGTPGYFSSCFKKQFGKYPTDLRAE